MRDFAQLLARSIKPDRLASPPAETSRWKPATEPRKPAGRSILQRHRARLAIGCRTVGAVLSLLLQACGGLIYLGWFIAWRRGDPEESPECREKAYQIWKNAIGLYLRVGQAVSEELRRDGHRKHRAQVLHLTSRDFRSLSSYIGFLPDALLQYYTEDELARAVEVGSLAAEYHQAAVEEHAKHPRDRGLFSIRFHRSDGCNAALLNAYVAAAYLHSYQGDTAQNLERARAHYESALELLKEEHAAELSGRIAISLGSLFLFYPSVHGEAYAQRTVHMFRDTQETLRFYAPLTKRIAEELSGKWVKRYFPSLPKRHVPELALSIMSATWRGLAPHVLYEFIAPESVANFEWSVGIAFQRLGRLEEALKQYDLALEIFPRTCFEERAAVRVSKGTAYLDATENRAANRDLALACFQEALGDCDEEIAPRTYVIALVKEAGARLERGSVGEPEEMVGQLRSAARMARWHGMDALSQEAFELLGEAYSQSKDFVRAYRALAFAVRIGERLHREARTTRLKSYWALSAAPAYERLLGLCAARIRPDETNGTPREQVHAEDLFLRIAFALAERSRTRFLQEQLSHRGLLPKGATREDLQEFLQLRRSWLESDLRLAHETDTAIYLKQPDILTKMEKRRALLEVRYHAELKEIRKRFNDPLYDPDEPVSSVRFKEMAQAVRALSGETETAVLEYFITDRQVLAFVIVPMHGKDDAKLFVLDTGVSRDELAELEARWSQGYSKMRKGLLHPIQWERGCFRQTLVRLRPLVEIPARVVKAWNGENGRHIARLVVIPHRFLHLVPLHAVPVTDGSLWGDGLSIQYAPSGAVLWHLLRSAQTRTVSADGPKIQSARALAVGYSPPSEKAGAACSLLFNEREIRAVAGFMGGEVLLGSDATPSRVIEAMPRASYLHFACHGVFEPQTPFRGGLELAPETPGKGDRDAGGNTGSEGTEPKIDRRLTLGDLFERVQIPDARLVVLSACETGVPQVEEHRDEYLGLPAGFLYAGAKTVISTLWPVSDLASWLLSESLAEHLASGAEAPDALRCAQYTLRTLRARHVADRIEKAASESEADLREAMLQEKRRISEGINPDTPVFSEPYWWAGYTVNGL